VTLYGTFTEAECLAWNAAWLAFVAFPDSGSRANVLDRLINLLRLSGDRL
jgi:hypothetical protein